MNEPQIPETTATDEEPARFGDVRLAAAFRAFLERHEGEAHIVALQDFPDPDAIAAGLASQKLAEPFGIRTDVVYEGGVSHQENRALVHVLDIDLTRFTDGFALDRYDGAVFIDNQGTTTRLKDRLDEAGVATLAVIDHHAIQHLLVPEFSDIRRVGAAATIFADYLHSGAILELDPGNPGHARLATALMHALRSETNGFMHAGSAEYAAGAYLSRYHDVVLVEKILHVQRSRGTMDVIRAALTNRRLIAGFSIAGVGYVRHADRDAVPQATDFLLTEETVGAAIVYGLLTGEVDQREVIVGSVRTNRLTLDIDGFLKRALGADARGRFYGGGRAGAGGFEIPVGFLEGSPDNEQMRLKWEAFDQQIRTKLMRAAGLDEQPDED